MIGAVIVIVVIIFCVYFINGHVNGIILSRAIIVIRAVATFPNAIFTAAAVFPSTSFIVVYPALEMTLHEFPALLQHASDGILELSDILAFSDCKQS